MNRLRSTCPHDCPDACGLLVETDGARVLKVDGDAAHPYSKGSLCPKVNHYEKTVHAPGRLLHPMVRDGAKGEGRFRRTSWEDAVSRITARWREIVRAHGAEAILPYSYAGTMGLVQRCAGEAFFHKLGASRLERTICTPAQDLGWAQVMGTTPGPDPDDAAHSDLVVLWGINAVATNVHFLSRAREARKRGGRVWLVETYRTPTAPLVDRVVLVRPGSDGALALGLLHLFAREGLVDRPFVDAEVLGWDAFEREVLPDYPPARVAALTGVPEAELVDLALALGRARAPFIRLGGGLSRYANGAATTRAITCIPAALGAWRNKGGGLLASTGSAAAFDLTELTGAALQPGPTRLVSMNRLGHALLELDAPRVMSLYVHTSNPAVVCPDQNAVLRGLAREDLFTVVHERFMTDTARYADVLLPAPTMLETSDLYRSYGQFQVQRTRPVIPPLGESRSNWDTFRTLASAMGFTEPVFQKTADEHVEALLDAPSPWRASLDRARLDAGEAVPLTPPRGAWLTPSGKIEVENPAADQRFPRHHATHAERDAAPLQLQTAPAVHALNSSFMEREELARRVGPLTVQLGPEEAARRGLEEGARARVHNALGEVEMRVRVTADVPPGIAVVEGVHWLSEGVARNVNALTSQRLTDEGGGSTFYDNKVEVTRA